MNSKIYYIDCFEKDNKERNIGFAKLEDDKIFFMLRGIPARSGIDCRVYLINDWNEKIEATDIPVRNGYGQAQCTWPKGMKRENCCSIYIPLYGQKYGKSVIKAQEPERKIIQKSEENKPVEPVKPFQEGIPTMAPDKWAQLMQTYPQVHIFPEADTVVIKPKDLVVLTQEYHELSANSFVLHAYYNYRQLLLLRYHDNGEPVYYLGVPGTYYDREKRIATMFGFEGFENGESRLVNEERRRAYTGCFGYYMKQVNI